MLEFMFQPDVYNTALSSSLLGLLGKMWINDHTAGVGCLYIISGFANYNGGVRFYPYFSEHIHRGGEIKVIVGGSSTQRLTSIQVVEALLNCDAEVYVVNRKRLVHAKCYGLKDNDGEELVVTSGNFTGPGMSQNAEAAIRIDKAHVQSMGFSWDRLIEGIFSQGWDIYPMSKNDIENKRDPAWQLLYDEIRAVVELEEEQMMSMVVLLSHSDTARIQATPGSNAALGTQYFWLSKGSFDFFPALTIRNNRGYKNTFSCNVNMNFVDLGITSTCRVTFEADNNLDFRLGTGPLRYTRIAEQGDLALITRRGEYDYEMRIIRQNADVYNILLRYAVTYIGNYGKRFGYIPNDVVDNILNHIT